MADEDGILDLQLLEQIGERVQGLIVHVGDGARFGEQIGVAGAVTRVDGDGASGGGGDVLRKVLPVRDRSEAFVKKHEFGHMRIAAGDACDFERVSVNGEMEGLEMGHLTRFAVEIGCPGCYDFGSTGDVWRCIQKIS